MKIINLLTVCATLFMLSSCTNDDPVNEPDITGTWNLTEITYSGTTVTEGSVQGFDFSSSLEFTGTGHDIDLQLTFSSDPNEYVTDGSYGVYLEGTMTTDGETIPFAQDLSDIILLNTGSWSIEDDMITFSDGSNGAVEYSIIQLAENIFIIDVSQSTSEEQSGITVTVTVDGSMSFSR